jgi:dihydroorotate dehydrogenase (fumarate)
MKTDLTTNYLGLQLANPLIVSACPLTGELDVLRKLQDLGAAAAVLPSLFEEQFEGGASDRGQSEAFYDQLAYHQELKEYNRGPEVYLKHIAAAKLAVSFPVIGSLNVTGPGDIARHARRIQEAGADALEINIYSVPTDPAVTAQQLEAQYVELVAATRSQISIPLAVKIGPYFTALPNFAQRLVDAGADGLVLFNRFLQPEIDLDHLRVDPRLRLSSSDELRLPLRWIAILHGRISASLAATSGIHFADDVARAILAGADAVMVASTLYQHGIGTLRTLIEGLSYWMESRDYHNLGQVKGALSQRRCPNPAAFERANYAKAIMSFLNDTVDV